MVRAGAGKGTAVHLAAKDSGRTLCGQVAGGVGGGIFEFNGCKRCRAAALGQGFTHATEFTQIGSSGERVAIGEKGYWD